MSGDDDEIDAILERHQGAMTKADYKAAGDDIRRLLATRDATIARLSVDLTLTREALDRFAALDPDGARAAITKLS